MRPMTEKLIVIVAIGIATGIVVFAGVKVLEAWGEMMQRTEDQVKAE